MSVGATDSCVGLVARRREALDRINQSKDPTDEEIDALYNKLLDPIERELVNTLPTTRAGILAVLDEVRSELRRYDPEVGWCGDFVVALVENARSAIARVIRGPDDHRTLSMSVADHQAMGPCTR